MQSNTSNRKFDEDFGCLPMTLSKPEDKSFLNEVVIVTMANKREMIIKHIYLFHTGIFAFSIQ